MSIYLTLFTFVGEEMDHQSSGRGTLDAPVPKPQHFLVQQMLGLAGAKIADCSCWCKDQAPRRKGTEVAESECVQAL